MAVSRLRKDRELTCNHVLTADTLKKSTQGQPLKTGE